MFKLENTTLNRLFFVLTISLLLLTSANAFERSVDGAVKYKIKKNKYTSYYVNTQKIKKFNFGRVATKNEIAAWNIDVMPDGTGLPDFDTKNGQIVLDKNKKPKKAQGSVSLGNSIYDSKCATCHGEFAAGGKGYPTLSAGSSSIKSLKNQLLNPASKHPGIEPPIKVIGTFWPYASTLFWYIQYSMPFNNPKSLTNSETYALVAYLLMENNISIDGVELDDDYVLDKKKFMKIVMPNEKGFYPNVNTQDPKTGIANMKKFLSNPKNYGNGTRCMKNCIKGKVPILRIKNELNDFYPKPSTARTWKEEKKLKGSTSSLKFAKIYKTSCAACHGNKAVGAPLLGDKEAWSEILKQGINKVYKNAINGVGAMPPKGGTSLSDDEFKKVVDYIINSSKQGENQ